MSSSFHETQRFVNIIKGVNDTAEKEAKLDSDDTAILTDNPGQRASILQAVQEKIQKFPGVFKADLAKPF